MRKLSGRKIKEAKGCYQCKHHYPFLGLTYERYSCICENPQSDHHLHVLEDSHLCSNWESKSPPPNTCEDCEYCWYQGGDSGECYLSRAHPKHVRREHIACAKWKPCTAPYRHNHCPSSDYEVK